LAQEMACALLKWALVATVVASLATAQPLSMCPCAAASEGYRQLWYAHPVGPAGSDEVRTLPTWGTIHHNNQQKQALLNTASSVASTMPPLSHAVLHQQQHLWCMLPISISLTFMQQSFHRQKQHKCISQSKAECSTALPCLQQLMTSQQTTDLALRSFTCCVFAGVLSLGCQRG
jgi:hypothetical protein